MSSFVPLISVLFGGVFFLWFTCFWWAVFLGGAAFALHGLVSALFAFWDFFIYWGVPTLVISLAAGVALCPNPINSLFCLIGVFLNSILLLLCIRVEFLSMIFLIVYIGAIAILFLFVIMLLNLRDLKGWKLDWTWLKEFDVLISQTPSLKFYLTAIRFVTQYWVTILWVGFSAKIYFHLTNLVAVSSYYNLKLFAFSQNVPQGRGYHYIFHYGFNDILLFSDLLYTEHLTLLLLSGMLLLSAMVGSIVLAISTVEETQ